MTLIRALASAAALVAVLAPCTADAGTITPGTPHKVNLVVTSDYDLGTPEDLEPMIEKASRYLFNATEKQMQLGKVEVYNNCPSVKSRADLVIYDKFTGFETMVSDRADGGKQKPPILRDDKHIKMGKKRLSLADPGHSLAHEFAHYLWIVHDEYSHKGDSRTEHKWTVTTDPLLPTHEVLHGFCNQPHYDGTTSMMVVGPPNPQPREFCTMADQGWHSDHTRGHVWLKTTMTMDGSWPWSGKKVIEHWHGYNNDQEWDTGMSSWERIEFMSARWLGISMPHPTSAPVNDSSGHGAIEFVVEPCGATTIFVIDRSGSMDSDGRLLWAKGQVGKTIDMLEDGTRVGAVSFAGSATTAFPIAPLDADTRASMKASIGLLSANGSTNIGGALTAAHNMLKARDPRDGAEAIVVLTDGEHTTGTPPEAVVPSLRADDIVVDFVGIGGDVDHAALSAMSDFTGGEAVFLTSPLDNGPAVVDRALHKSGYRTMAAWDGAIDPAQSIAHDLWVDELTDQIVVSLTTPLHMTSLELTDPNGLLVDETHPDVELLSSGGGATLRVRNPTVGAWILTAHPANGAIWAAPYRLTAYDNTAAVAVSTEVTGGVFGSNVFGVPEPIRIRTDVVVRGESVAGASVVAEIRHPDLSMTQLTLHDDGQPEHGDPVADDGAYNALFFGYGPFGNHAIRVHVDTEGGHGVARPHGAPGEEEALSEPIVRVQRTNEASAFLLGFPGLLEPGTMNVGPAASGPLAENLAVPAGASHIVVGKARISVDSPEYVSVSELVLEDVGDGNLADVSMVRLYVDADEDGLPDRQGDWGQPIAQGHYDADTRRVTFEGVTLPPAFEHDVVVTYDFAGDLELAVPTATVPEGGDTETGSALPLALLSLLFFSAACVSRRRRSALAPAAFAVLMVVACGDDDGAPPASEPEGEQSTVPDRITAFQVRLDPSLWIAVGATTGEVVPVDGEPQAAPVITLAHFE